MQKKIEIIAKTQEEALEEADYIYQVKKYL